MRLRLVGRFGQFGQMSKGRLSGEAYKCLKSNENITWHKPCAWGGYLGLRPTGPGCKRFGPYFL